MVSAERPRYFGFYWPLALTGLSMLLARQFQNGALARFPDPARELAVFALASSTFMLFNAMFGFVPQMTNVLARNSRDSRTLLLFLLASGAILTAPLAFLALTPPGEALLGALYGIEGGTLADVVRYLRLLSPLILVNTLRQYNVGRLIQSGRTVTVTVLNAVYLSAVIVILVAGHAGGMGALATLAAAQVASALLHFGLSTACRLRLPRLPEEPKGPLLTFSAAFRYYWPVAVTSVMFALSRPAIYTFAGRVRDAEPLIASLRVAFDFAIIFHDPLNQFRNLFATFGEADLAGMRRFMVKVTAATTLLMAAAAFTPPGEWIFERLLGLDPGMVPAVRAVMAPLCAIPAVVTVRNYFHGLALVRRRTGSMALGGVMRVAAIFGASWALWAAGMLTPLGAGIALLSGFAAETLAVVLATAGKEGGTGPAIEPGEAA